MSNLNDIIEINMNFKTAINLYLSLNKKEKILNYIPTKSSVEVLNSYVDAVLERKEQASLLVGPYGKGKSHLLLVLLAILSMDRTKESTLVINKIIKKIENVESVDENIVEKIETIWNNKGRFLPVIINASTGDLNQAFLSAINEALKREDLLDITPDTFYSIAIKRINDWKKDYPETYKLFKKEIENNNMDINEVIAGLKQFSKESLDIFSKVYPLITSGSTFNPLVVSDVLSLYKGISEKLVEEYGYSGIYIVFDEFSKFIEGQQGKNIGNNMKLLQDICELATDSHNAEVHITMVAHKSIKEYGKYLSTDIINSFTGIEGRIVEKFFVTSSKNNYELIKNAIVKKINDVTEIPNFETLVGDRVLNKYYQLPIFCSNFNKNDFRNIILYGCYPLNPIATYLLLNISEKVAQNERTLFTFISNDEAHSMARYIKEHNENQDWIIGAELIYDYFSGLFKKNVSNELIHNIWLAAEYALSKCNNESEFRLIKSLAIILIVNKEEEIPADDMYLPLSTKIDNFENIINSLVERNIIYQKKSNGSYVFKTKASSDLKKDIKRQRDIKGYNTNYTGTLREITGKYFVIPRKYNIEHSMTRYFTHEYMDVETFLDINNANVFFDKNETSDGKVITLFSFTKTKQSKVKEHIRKLNDSRLVIVSPKEKLSIEKQIRDYEILVEIKKNIVLSERDEVLKREIPLLEDELISVIENELLKVYQDDEECKVNYILNGRVKNEVAGSEEKAVNNLCEKIYYKTPIINNELINRTNLVTAQTKKARLNIINAILNHKDTEDFYSGTNQEATIYRALFPHICREGEAIDSALEEIFKLINLFIDSCCEGKKSLSDIIDIIVSEPYGMRKGVIPIYIAKVFSERKEDLVVYFSELEVEINADIINSMCDDTNNYALFVSKEDLQKEKYIASLNELFRVKENRNLSENRIKDVVLCMQRWFRALPQVTRNLVLIDEYYEEEYVQKNMLLMRKELQKVDFNPYEMLFVTLPEEFRCDTLEETFECIDSCKTSFDDYFDWVLKRVVEETYKIFEPRKKKDLYHTFVEWYENQSDLSKQGLHSSKVTNLMSCIQKLNVFNDSEVTKKIVKIVTDIYIENWTDNSYNSYIEDLFMLKSEVESIKEENISNKCELSFVTRKGDKRSVFYDIVDEGTGNVLRNILEDTLEEYDDLSVNDRVGILLEMIEKIIG
ncbi:MAG: hypothetical protein ACLRZ9_00970 [Eubacterium sp.]